VFRTQFVVNTHIASDWDEHMRIFLTGASGYIGGAIARAAVAAGHDVRALVRTDGTADRVRELGATPLAGDLHDTARLEQAARDADAVIHAAYTQDADGASTDTAAAEAFVRGVRGSDRPFIYTSGIWVLGPSGDGWLDEDTPRNPLPLVAWRGPLEERLRAAAANGARTIIVRPAIAYGYAGGIPAMLVRDAAERGTVRVVGDGRQRWPVVHVDDLAALYLLALSAPASGVYNAASGASFAMRDLALAAGVAAGRPPVVATWPLDDARAALGPFADALALDQRVSTQRTHRELGWQPTAPSLLEELLHGSYAATRERTAA
jgi:nucleoside-diphosphate-sugar epimerase